MVVALSGKKLNTDMLHYLCRAAITASKKQERQQAQLKLVKHKAPLVLVITTPVLIARRCSI